MGIRWRNGGAGRSGVAEPDRHHDFEDLAKTEVNIIRTQIAFMILFALVIAMAMKIVGILLVAALLIIPAAAARRLRTPEQMAIFAAVAGSIAVALGLGISFDGTAIRPGDRRHRGTHLCRHACSDRMRAG